MKQLRTVVGRRNGSIRPRKLGVAINQTEYYSPHDLRDIQEGLAQIKRGECISHAELKRREGL